MHPLLAPVLYNPSNQQGLVIVRQYLICGPALRTTEPHRSGAITRNRASSRCAVFTHCLLEPAPAQ